MKYFPSRSLCAALLAAMLSPLLCGCTRVLPEDYVNPYDTSGAQSSQETSSVESSKPEIQDILPPSSSQPDEDRPPAKSPPAPRSRRRTPAMFRP